LSSRPTLDTVPAMTGQSAPTLESDLRGAAAEAIRAAEAALVRQNSVTAQVDLQVVTAVLNAHAANAGGAAALEGLQREIEAAVTTRTDLDTPAGARAFQRYLTDKLQDIRGVVEDADLDSTSKATLAAALASLYVSAGALPEDGGSDSRDTPMRDDLESELPIADFGLDDPALSAAAVDPATEVVETAPNGSGAPTVPAAAAPPPMLPSAAFPSAGMPFGGSAPLTGLSLPTLSPDPELSDPEPSAKGPADLGEGDSTEGDSTEGDTSEGDTSEIDPSMVRLPDGETITAPNPELAAVISAAVDGTPIPDAFLAQGITLPAAGSPVGVSVEPDRLLPGDVGVFTDRYALALGNGKALVDGQIQPVTDLGGPDFLGWQPPPVPVPGEQTTGPQPSDAAQQPAD